MLPTAPHTRRLALALGLLAALLPAQSDREAPQRDAPPAQRTDEAAETGSPVVVADALLDAAFVPTVEETFAPVRYLATDELAGRAAGTPGGIAAREYLVERFAELGLEPAFEEDSYLQPFRLVRTVVVDGERQGEKIECANVIGWLRGSDERLADEFLLVGAHYDHIGTGEEGVYNGADDNASGIAALLAIARALTVEGAPKPRRSVLFCAFDAEELGLHGASFFCRNPPRSLQQLVTMINIDMLGRGKLLDRKMFALPKAFAKIPRGPALGVVGTGRSPELDRIVRAVFEAEELPVFAPDDFGALAPTIRKMAEGRADHAPFEQRRIPFLFFSNSEHDDYHEPTDDIDTLDPDALHHGARAIWRTLLAIDAVDERPTFVDPKPSGDEGDSEEGDGGEKAGAEDASGQKKDR
jgi:hypothetical protein